MNLWPCALGDRDHPRFAVCITHWVLCSFYHLNSICFLSLIVVLWSSSIIYVTVANLCVQVATEKIPQVKEVAHISSNICWRNLYFYPIKRMNLFINWWTVTQVGLKHFIQLFVSQIIVINSVRVKVMVQPTSIDNSIERHMSVNFYRRSQKWGPITTRSSIDKSPFLYSNQRIWTALSSTFQVQGEEI